MKAEALAVLRDLQRSVGGLDRDRLVLGGPLTRLALSIAGGTGNRPPVRPLEFDLLFPAASWDEFDRIAAGLAGQGFRRTPREDRFSHPSGAILSLWPLGDGIAPEGRLLWRGSGATVFTAGLELALARSLPAPAGKGLDLLVPPLHLLVLVRIVFYLGRKAPLDLAETVKCLAGAPAASLPAGRGAEPEENPGAFRLGAELGQTVPPALLRLPRRFAGEVEAVHAPAIAHLFRERGGIDPGEGPRLERLFGLFRSFRRGLESAGDPPPPAGLDFPRRGN
ncbi:MAG: hypothetical protein HY509_02385 [Acidobacteria bacterium]|nr:hypothetical protein [Acidobacteriota bacterium]